MPTKKRSVQRKRTVRVQPEPTTDQPMIPPPPKGPSNLIIMLLIVVSFFAGYLFFKVKNLEQKNTVQNQQNQPQQQPQAPTELKIKKPETSEHWLGSKDVRYVWVEYSDLECPFCKKNHPDLQKLLKEYEGKIAWVYRHFPLAFHPKAQKSAEAVECATELGGNDGFWKMADLIFEKMPEMELADLPTLGAQIGLDANALKLCLDSNKFEKQVKNQSNEGNQAGVRATPTGVIYDLKTGKTQVVEGAYPYDSLKQSLNDFIAKNK